MKGLRNVQVVRIKQVGRRTWLELYSVGSTLHRSDIWIAGHFNYKLVSLSSCDVLMSISRVVLVSILLYRQTKNKQDIFCWCQCVAEMQGVRIMKLLK